MSQRKRPGLIQRGRVWHIAIYHGGKAIRRSLETEDRERAEQAYDKIRSEAWDEKHLKKEPERYWEEAALAYVERFNRLVEAKERKAGSFDRERFAWLNEKLKGRPLREITKKFLGKLLADMTPASQRHYSAIVNAVLAVAVEEELMAAAPSVTIGKNGTRSRWAKEDEAKLLLGNAGDLFDPILFSLATGLRQSNVLGLRWAWIKDRTVIVPEGEFKQGREHVQPLNRAAMSCIQRQLGKHEEFVFAFRGEPMQKLHGGRMRPAKAVQGAWERASSVLDDFHWHDMRHTWASWSLQAGVPEPIVETLGGWQSGKMVRRYAHASVEFLRPYAEMIDPLLGRLQHTSNTEGVVLEAVK